MVGSKKKAVAPQAYNNNSSVYSSNIPKTMKKPYKTKVKVKTKKNATKQASERFRKITERAKKIRDNHPKMKWKNAIKKASKELF